MVADSGTVTPTTLPKLAGVLGGLCWVAKAVLDDGDGPESVINALHYGGLALLALALLGIGAGLVSGLAALRVVVALCLLALAWAVLEFLHQQAPGPDGRRGRGRADGALLRGRAAVAATDAGRRAARPSRGVRAGLARGLTHAGTCREQPRHAAGCPQGDRSPRVQEVWMGTLRRLAMISLHTSPLDQPGTGDAGGMNVYVIELAKRLVRQGIEVDIFTRATTSRLGAVVEAADGVTVRHIHAGPFEGLTKHELPAQLCVFAREVLRTEAAQPLGHYDLVHSHYWLSGQVGALARDRWGVPLVHSMHTMAKVKNAALAEGDTPEPLARRDRRGAGRRGRGHAHRQHRRSRPRS